VPPENLTCYKTVVFRHNLTSLTSADTIDVKLLYILCVNKVVKCCNLILTKCVQQSKNWRVNQINVTQFSDIILSRLEIDTANGNLSGITSTFRIIPLLITCLQIVFHIVSIHPNFMCLTPAVRKLSQSKLRLFSNGEQLMLYTNRTRTKANIFGRSQN
jgi:hypothetical protein